MACYAAAATTAHTLRCFLTAETSAGRLATPFPFRRRRRLSQSPSPSLFDKRRLNGDNNEKIATSTQPSSSAPENSLGAARTTEGVVQPWVTDISCRGVRVPRARAAVSAVIFVFLGGPFVCNPPPALALLEVRDGLYVSDADVAATAAATIAALALASLSFGAGARWNSSADSATDTDVDANPLAALAALAERLNERLYAAEALEVRLDVTTLWCFILARELLTVPPGGRIVDLGFSAEDITRLGCVAASAGRGATHVHAKSSRFLLSYEAVKQPTP